MTLVAALLIL